MARVHRDIYKNDVDFTAIALQYPEFAKRLKSNRQLDFSDPETVRQLTKALLHRDFDLSLDLPEDRLCPPVPNRLNYIFWLQDLLDSTSEDYRDNFNPQRRIIGVDIGTGSSCIYPLLGCRQFALWRFLVTEIDAKSREYAQRNINSNALNSRIRFLYTDETAQSLLPVEQLENFEEIDFVMTNPPFYESESEMLESAKKKQRPPNSACTGAPVEMITTGGEVQFVSKLLLESMSPSLRLRIQWFTSMLGKLSSMTSIVERLREHGCTNYAVTEFIQGQKTRRWAVAWSWRSLRPKVEVARGIPGMEKRLFPFPSEFDFDIKCDIQSAGVKINEQITSLDLQWQWKAPVLVGLGLAKHDVWSRKARRRKQRAGRDEDGDHGMGGEAEEQSQYDDNDEPALVFKISLTGKLEQARTVCITVRWIQGQDSVLFESFCGWLKRRVGSGG